MSNDKTCSESVYEQIKKRIISMEHKPGDALIEQRICQELHVSRTPVRKALRLLEREGLVSYIPNKGVYVKALSMKEINEIYSIRALMEGYCARVAARIITDEQISHLENTLEEARVKLDEGLLTEASVIAADLHRVLIDLADNKRIKQILVEIGQEEGRLRLLSEGIAEKLMQSDIEHRGIVEAIKKRDAILAEQRMVEHIKGVQLDAFSEYFSKK